MAYIKKYEIFKCYSLSENILLQGINQNKTREEKKYKTVPENEFDIANVNMTQIICIFPHSNTAHMNVSFPLIKMTASKHAVTCHLVTFVTFVTLYAAHAVNYCNCTVAFSIWQFSFRM